MNRRMFAVALAAAVAPLAIQPVAARADDQPPPRIMVMGEGEATVAPDLAILSLAVMKEAATAQEAMAANTKAMTDVIAALKGMGIAERDLQTSSIQINPRYNYTNKPDGSQEAVLAAYQVSNTLTIRVREIARAGEVIDTAVKLGVNQGGSIMFSNDDPAATITEARKKAVADAMAKAKTLTEAAGVGLGRILEMSELSYSQAPIPIEAKAYAAAPADAVPVQAGENAYRIQVNVTFELK